MPEERSDSLPRCCFVLGLCLVGLVLHDARAQERAPRIFHAQGVMPVGIMGGGDDLEIIRGDAYYQSYICHIPRSTVELGLRVAIVQFMKGDLYAGEWDGIGSLPGVELIATGKGFCGIQGNPYPHSEHRQNAQDAIGLVHEKMSSGTFDLVVLDEINNSLQLKLVDLEQVLQILDASLVHALEPAAFR